METRDLAKYIDHTVLKAVTAESDVRRICREAVENGFYAVCIPPSYISEAKDALAGSEVKTATVIGFPLGNSTTETKVFEAADALGKGADEIDMVINIGALKSGLLELVLEDIRSVAEVVHGKSALLKVIIETSALDEDEKIIATDFAVRGGADFVKTSTGFGEGGATVDDVALMKEVIEGKARIKASGGIRDREFAEKLIEAGADRLGTSAGVAICRKD